MSTKPSHITQAQASRILKCSKQTVYRNALRGCPLEAEKLFRTWMIPIEKVYKFKEQRSIPKKRIESFPLC